MNEIKDMEKQAKHNKENYMLTFADFQEINRVRCELAFRHPVNDWNINDWATAVGGEMGETIQEIGKLLTFLDTAKKIRRLDDPEKLEQLVDQVAEELADIITYCDLTMTRINRDTATEIIKKFNKVSDKRNCDIKI